MFRWLTQGFDSQEKTKAQTPASMNDLELERYTQQLTKQQKGRIELIRSLEKEEQEGKTDHSQQGRILNQARMGLQEIEANLKLAEQEKHKRRGQIQH